MKFWLISILLFLAARYLLPILVRLALHSFMRKQMRNGGFEVPPQAQANNSSATARPGEVRVDYVPPTAAQPSKQHGFTGGEYVDFEEVK